MQTRNWMAGVTAGGMLLGMIACGGTKKGGAAAADEAARAFLARHLEKTQPLEKEANLAWWNANISGRDEDFQVKEKAENALDKVLADPKAFDEVKAIRDRGGIRDALVKREIDLVYLSYLGKQVDPKLLEQMNAKSNQVEKTFNVYRAQAGDRKLTDNDVRKILRESKDSGERERAWKASKGVGREVEPTLKELVKLRNEAARKLGFRDFYAMSLYLNEQDEGALLALFGELDDLTRRPFQEMKARLDKALAARYKIGVEELRPWHYEDPFFQEAPSVGKLNLDALYAKKDIVKIVQRFYDGLGLPIEDVLARSDLYEKPGKSPHAFSTDIDRLGDVRVLGNIRPNDRWMNTMLHEMGHAVYEKNIDPQLPYELRTEAHILTTEGIAMMFGRVNKRAEWFTWALGLDRRRAARYGTEARRELRMETLIFSRWCQVMLHFERAMYANPDQDLSKLWWDLVEKYQGLRRPENRSEPDYASKIHLVTAPVYYHNYMMGELFASQVHHALARRLGVNDPAGFAYVDRKDVGEFLKKEVFGPGARYPWNELTRLATGEPLTASYYAQDFVKE
ncbi:MAG TPA: M2 family metallopeptidase [Bryobacterales bacterium]|nr:M2 family metallopeptidase [Bryobacterales bacterium]